MRPSLLPRLVNGPFEDPALFIRFLFENRAIMFDLGDIHALSTRDILKLTHVFVTHTHMDHFAGFDRLLRIFLGREKQLHLFGPQGFIRNVEGKLGGYQWNLAKNFTNRFSIKEKFHINIKKDALEALGLIPGPWIQAFKQALYEKQPPDTPIKIRCSETTRRYSLGTLSNQIALITPGQKITYVTDVLYSPDNLDKIIAFADGSDRFYIEAAFLETDAHMAAQKYHLTAKQAGEIAGRARAKKIVPFHFSPRYTGNAHGLEREALTAFNRSE